MIFPVRSEVASPPAGPAAPLVSNETVVSMEEIKAPSSMLPDTAIGLALMSLEIAAAWACVVLLGRITVAMVVSMLRRARLCEPAESTSARSAALHATPAAVIRPQNAGLRRACKEARVDVDSSVKPTSNVTEIEK